MKRQLPEKIINQKALNAQEAVSHLGLKYNALIDYLEEREGNSIPGEALDGRTPPVVEKKRTGEKCTNCQPDKNYVCIRHTLGYNQIVQIPKPEWWEEENSLGTGTIVQAAYLEALQAASKASGINFELV